MTNTITDRAKLLITHLALNEVAETNSKEYVRWQNVKRGRARVGAEEIEALAEFFPNWKWWLLTGEVMPEMGQTSPDYDKANKNLNKHLVG